MTEKDRLIRLENAVTNVNEKFSEFIALESARKERDKHQVLVNSKLVEFMDSYIENDKPVIEKARKQQEWIGFYVGRILLPVVIGAILLSAGAQMYDRSSPQKAETNK